MHLEKLREALAALAVFVAIYVAVQHAHETRQTSEHGASHVSPTWLSRDEARSDIDDLWAKLVAVHPDLTWHVSPAELEEAYARTRESIPVQVTVDELYLHATALIAKVRDSHSVVYPPVSSHRLGIPWKLRGDALCFTRPVVLFPAGACVETLGGRPMPEVLNAGRSLVSAETQVGIDRLVPEVVPALFRGWGESEPLAVRVRTPSGGTVDAPLELERMTDTAQESALSFRALPNRIVLLTVRTMVPIDDFYEGWFEGFFAGLAEQRVRGLIVDLRRNEGGSTRVGDLLLSYVTTKPYRLFGAKLWRVSKPMQQRLVEAGANVREYLDAKPDDLVTHRVDMEVPPVRRHRFAGPTVFLIGPDTLSAAMMTANAVRDIGLGVLVGRPTSSPPNYFGEVYDYTMKHAGLTVSISTARFIRASGDAEDDGVVEPHAIAADKIQDSDAREREEVRLATVAIETWHDTSARYDESQDQSSLVLRE